MWISGRWLVLLGFRGAVLGQAPATVCVRDGQGRPVAGATISRGVEQNGAGRAVAGGDGCAAVAVATQGYARGVLSAERDGFVPATVTEPQPGERVQVVLQLLTVKQQVTVTADRGLAGVTDEATSVAVLDGTQMGAEPGLSLDDRLHQVAGFQLYRRTSSWTANPTTEGVSLRGLGSTAASRTLVESDEVPLNDPFGGWIHWDEVPPLAIADVVIERGGAANLYGSSAIGGVIALEPVVAGGEGRLRVAADATGASEDSGEGDLLVMGATRFGQGLLAGSGLRTGGYLPTAPEFRGAVDGPANVAEESGRAEARHGFGFRGDGKGKLPPGSTSRRTEATPSEEAPASPVAPTIALPATAKDMTGTVFLRGNVLNEVRGNGTPDQTNGTRLWRYTGGGDIAGGGEHETHGSLRVFGDRETYRQSFSAIAVNRDSEILTRTQRVPVDEFGFAVTVSRVVKTGITAGLGLDLRDVRGTDAETPVSRGVAGATTAISAHQRASGGYAEGVWRRGGWTVAGSVRVDGFRTFDGRGVTAGGGAVVKEPVVSEVVASPHLGLVRRLPGGLALTASAFRAFRGPTLNELYRTGQVGGQTTLANPALVSERATGLEFGSEFADMRVRGREVGRLRASYFWTEVNRPVSAVVLSQTATTQTLQRQNLGQIRSRGLSLEAGTARWRGLEIGAGWQVAVGTVTRFDAASAVQANLSGKWIPEVTREMAASTVHWARPGWADVTAVVSYTGRAFDDAANQLPLRGYARVDVSAERALGRGVSVYAGAQNVLDRVIEAGRTPVLTLAAPRLVQGGVRWSMGR